MKTASTWTRASGSPGIWQAQAVRICAIRNECEGVQSYDLAFCDGDVAARYRFEPGQFNMLYVPGAGEAAISVSSDPQRLDLLTHTIRTAGNVTRSLARMRAGDTFGLRGPFGRPWPMHECIGRDVLLVAGGIGLAPLRPAIYRLLDSRRQFGRLHLLYGARSPDTLLYRDEFEAWSRRGLVVQCTVDRSTPDWLGHVGVVTLLLERLRSFDARGSVLFCCGPEVMMRFTALTAMRRGIPADRIWISMERNMQCAVGWCGHCQWGPEFVCQDGPVFRYDRVAQWLQTEGL